MNRSPIAVRLDVRRTLVVALAGLASTPAWAAEHGLYVGGGVTRSHYAIDNPNGAAPFDDDGSGYKLIAGFRPLDKLGAEISYTDAGHATLPTGIVCIALFRAPCPTETRLSTTAISAFALGHIDLPVVDLFAKAGVADWSVDLDPLVQPFIDDDGKDFAWGVGAALKIRRFAARIEYERFEITGGRPLGLVSVSVLWTLR